MEVAFNTSGEFITKLAREWMFIEGKPYQKVMGLLLSCMCGTDTPECELRRLAEDVLLGRAEFKGETADETFHLCVYDAEEQPLLPENMDVFKIVIRMQKELEETKEELQKMREWYFVAMEKLPEYLREDVRKETGQQPVDSGVLTGALKSFIDRMSDTEEHTTEDYGWLEPDGTFHNVVWGEHQQWAIDYLERNHPELADNDDVDMQVKCGVGLIGAGDWLVEHGWVLMHNPSQGVAFPTKNPVGRMTKAQKEFLYDYYMERRLKREADDVWKEEE